MTSSYRAPFSWSVGRSAPRRPASLLRVEALEDRALPAPVTFTLAGKAQWTDGANNKHQIPQATVEIVEYDGATETVIGTSKTNAAGNYSATVTFDDGAGDGNPDVAVRVLARSPAADVKPTGAGAKTYALTSAKINEVAAGKTAVPDLIAGNATDNDTAFSVHHALVMIGQYTSTLAGSMPSQVDTRYDASVTGSYFSSASKQLVIRGTAKFEWDVIHHEYGHYVQNIHKFQNNPGGKHSFNDNLSSTRGSKDIGVRLAWGEGWPTFFAISGQQESGANALGIPQVGDTSYTGYVGAVNFNLETSPGVGEDNETSVIATLWDAFDAAGDGVDRVSIGAKSLFSTFKSASVKTMGAAWEAMAAPLDKAGKARLGAVFGQNMIAPVITSPADNTAMGNTPPTITWQKNGGGVPNPHNDFRVRFYSADFNKLVFEKAVGDVDSYTPEAGDWNTIKGGGDQVKVVVEGKNKTAPVTPGGALEYYWSGARTLGVGVPIVFVIDDTGSMGEEIASVRTALQQYINAVEAKLAPGATPPTIQLITFKDNVTVRITSNDLAAVRTAVGGLVAEGGGDCPEFSAQGLAAAAESVATAGTILLATDASAKPGVDMSAVLAQLRAKRVTVNTILSGDCGPIGSSEPSPAGSLADGSNPDDGECNGDDTDCGCGSDDDSGDAPSLGAGGGGGSGGRLSEPGEPGGIDEDPIQTDIVDAGQAPMDDHGDDAETATVLLPDSRVLGNVGRSGDGADWFALPAAKAGDRVGVTVQGLGGSISYAIVRADGTALSKGSGSLFGETTESVAITAPDAGPFFFRLTSSFDATYIVSPTTDPLAGVTSAVDLYSTISAQTGGTFLVRDDVNSGDPAAYVAALFNVMASTLGPTVLASNPQTAPSGQTLAVTLTARGTNWRAGATTLTFSNPGLVVQSVTITSPTTLTAVVQVASGVAAGFYDATATTPLGSTTETAQGQDVLEVTGAITGPAVLSVTPDAIVQGATGTVTVRGANVTWNGTVGVSFGPGVTVTAVRAVSATELAADVTVAAGADVGFRTAVITQTGQSDLTLTRAMFVQATGVRVPRVTALSVTTVRQGTTATVGVTGEFTNFQAGVTTASAGDGVRIVGVTVNSPTQAVLQLAIDAGAAIGFRTVSLTTGGETAVLIDGLFVDVAPPVVPPVVPPITPPLVLPGPGLIGTRSVAAGDAAGAGGVRMLNSAGVEQRAFGALPAAFAGGVRLASADFTGDGVADVAIVTAPGVSNRVLVLDGASGAEAFTATVFEESFKLGLQVTGGDLDGDGKAELVVSADNGGSGRVRVYRGGSYEPVADFFGIEDPDFRGGATVAVGDVNGDGRADLLVGAGVGGGPRVAIYDGSKLGPNGGPKLVGDFYLFEPETRVGVSVAAGDVNGDGRADVIGGPGVGGGPRLHVLSGVDLLTGTITNIADFFVGDPESRNGVRPVVKNLDEDRFADLLVGASSGADRKPVALAGSRLAIGNTTDPLTSFNTSDLLGAVYVG